MISTIFSLMFLLRIRRESNRAVSLPQSLNILRSNYGTSINKSITAIYTPEKELEKGIN